MKRSPNHDETRQGIRRPQGLSAGIQTINQKKEAIRL
jgi:hypothetical protein